MRTFTPDEANALLGELRPLVEQLVDRKRRLDEAEETHRGLLARIGSNGGDITPSDVAEVTQSVDREAEALGGLLEQIQARGVQIKDLDIGLLDFPWLHEGAVALLCWRLGEEEIGYWHGIDEGYAGRKPL